MEVGRSLAEIDQKVKQLNSSLNQSNQLVRELDKSIKLDPKNIEALTNKMKNLQTQVGIATQKVSLLKQKQLEASKAFQSGEMTAKEFNKIEIAVVKAENELKKYNNELKNSTNSRTITNIGKMSKNFDSVTNSLKKAQKAAKAFSKAALALIASVTASITAFTAQTNTLNENAQAFDISIEKLQLQRNIYKQITGDAENYDSAMSSLQNVMKSIALGTGSAYTNILNRIGVSTTDLNGKTKSLSQIYDEVLFGLSEMENITLRNSLAYELFGEDALSVLDVMQTSSETIAELNEKQMELGITTSEQAEVAAQFKETWDELKLKFMEVGAQLAEALLPVIQALTEFVIEFILPILTSIINWFNGMSPQQQKFTLFLLLMIVLLPKIIAIITAIVGVVKAITMASYGAAGGIGAVSAASTPLIPIALAVVAVILTLALLFAFLTGRSKELTSTLNSQASTMSDLESSYSGMENDFNVNTTQVSQNANTSNSNIHVDVEAHGDTEISQQSAEFVADALAERINKELGGKI